MWPIAPQAPHFSCRRNQKNCNQSVQTNIMCSFHSQQNTFRRIDHISDKQEYFLIFCTFRSGRSLAFLAFFSGGPLNLSFSWFRLRRRSCSWILRLSFLISSLCCSSNNANLRLQKHEEHTQTLLLIKITILFYTFINNNTFFFIFFFTFVNIYIKHFK